MIQLKIFLKKCFSYLLIIANLFLLKTSYSNKNISLSSSSIPLSIKLVMISNHINEDFYFNISKYKTFNEDKFLEYYLESKSLPTPINYIYLLNKINYPNFLSFNENLYPAITNPITLVNPKFYLLDNYTPSDLIIVKQFDHIKRDNEMQISSSITDAYRRLVDFVYINNQQLILYSAYRSYDYQKTLYKIDNPYTAKPGHSEHQTGFAVDVSNFYYGLSSNLNNSELFKLLSENAHLFGFILRYPENKEKLTGYPFEPWHYRYVGEEISKTIYQEDLCLEEYFYKYVLLTY